MKMRHIRKEFVITFHHISCQPNIWTRRSNLIFQDYWLFDQLFSYSSCMTKPNVTLKPCCIFRRTNSSFCRCIDYSIEMGRKTAKNIRSSFYSSSWWMCLLSERVIEFRFNHNPSTQSNLEKMLVHTHRHAMPVPKERREIYRCFMWLFFIPFFFL